MPGNSCKVTDHFNHRVLAVPLALYYAGISQQKDVKALKTARWALFILLLVIQSVSFWLCLNTANGWHMGRLTEKQEGWAQASMMTFFYPHDNFNWSSRGSFDLLISLLQTISLQSRLTPILLTLYVWPKSYKWQASGCRKSRLWG